MQNFFDLVASNINPLMLSRIQFAFTVSFHIIFPSFTIGLASFLAVIEWCLLKTKNPVYQELYKFWSKIFAIAFGLGVVSGVVLSYQFGTNWSVFSHKIGNILGPLLGFEVLTAFFLEASFLGIMLFGWNRVSPKMHFFATLMVAIGTLSSAFWILAANSWMQTPSGFTVANDGALIPTSWLAIIFNPSFPYRLCHMVTAAYLTTAFVITGVGSFYLLQHKHRAHAKIMLKMGLGLSLIFMPLQVFIGHAHGLNTVEYQPAKVAAMEGIWETKKGAGLKLFGIPDANNETTKYTIELPKAASLILTNSFNGEVKGLKEWSKDERPPVGIVFWCFRIMVGVGLLMLITPIIALLLYRKDQLFNTSWFHRWCVLLSPSGFIAILSGWFVTEVGRQPYIIQGLLKTKDAVSPVTSLQVSASLLCFVVVYSIIFSAGVYYLLKTIQHGPDEDDKYYGSHGLERPAQLGDMVDNLNRGPNLC